MPPKRKTSGTTVAKPKKIKGVSPVTALPKLSTLPSTSSYRTFIDNLTGLPPSKLVPGTAKKNQTSIKDWRGMPTTTHEGQIVDEIAKKFNTNKTIGIPRIKYTKGSGQTHYYDPFQEKHSVPELTLGPPPHGKVGEGPLPTSVAHELMHANDHQSRLPTDRLNPAVWQNLGQLAMTGGPLNSANTPTSMRSFDDFENSIGRIQEKITPAGEFKPNPIYPGTGYPFDRSYIEYELQGATGKPYSTPFKGSGRNKTPDWPQLFTDINTAVNAPNLSSTAAAPLPPNQGFYLNRASEFPAYMSERLTAPWGTNTNTGSPALSRPEARFIHSTLGNMANSYTEADAPVMNHYIRERRNSIERAYEPPTATTYQAPHTPAAQALGLSAPSLGLPPGTPFAQGGLASLIRPKRKKSPRY